MIHVLPLLVKEKMLPHFFAERGLFIDYFAIAGRHFCCILPIMNIPAVYL